MVEVTIQKVVGYCRVSTECQEDNTSLPEQVKRIEAYAISQGWTVDRMFIEQGSGGTVDGRPVYREMVQYAKDNHIDAVVVFKSDRVHRSLKNLLIMLEDDLEPNGIAFVSVSERFDTSTPQGMLFLQMLGSFAEFERKQIAARTKGGRLATAKAGKLAGGEAPYGYDLVNGEMVVNSEQAEVVRRAFKQALCGLSLQKIADALNADNISTKSGKPWSKQTVCYMLNNRTYLGLVTYNGREEQNGIEVQGQHEPIISKVSFGKVQSQLRQRAKR